MSCVKSPMACRVLKWSLCAMMIFMSHEVFAAPFQKDDWVLGGWQQLKEDHVDHALLVWQKGMNHQPEHRLFAVLGAYVPLSNAIQKVQQVGPGYKTLVIRTSLSGKKMFFVLSALDVSPDKKLRQKQLASLIQKASLKSLLLANEAGRFKTGPKNRVQAFHHASSMRLSKKQAKSDHDRAIQLARKNQYSNAFKLFDPYVKYPEQFPSIAIDNIVVMNWSGHHQAAIDAYQSLPTDIAQPEYLKLAVADSYFQTKFYQKSYALYSKVLKVNPNSTKAQNGIIQNLVQRQEYVKALKYFEKLSINDQGQYALLLFLAEKYTHGLDVYHRMLLNAKSKTDRANLKNRLIKTDAKKKNKMLIDVKLLFRKKQLAVVDYFLFMDLLGKKLAKDETVPAMIDYSSFSHQALSAAAWFLYRSNRLKESQKMFLAAVVKNRSSFQAKLGLLYIHIRFNQFAKAKVMIASMKKHHANDFDFLYAYAFYYEKTKDFWSAIKIYERILGKRPSDKVARKLQLSALSRLNAVTQAKIEAKQDFPKDLKYYATLQHDYAMHQLHWDESHQALETLEPLLKYKIRSIQFDYVPTLVNVGQVKKATQAYEKLIADGITPPLWLQQIAAGAYLTIEQREKALHIYNNVLKGLSKSNDALKRQKKMFTSRIGKFYALYELQRWDEAGAVLTSLEKENRPWKIGRHLLTERINHRRVTIAMARGSWLVGQQRLPEADAFFTRLVEAAPGNIDFREALANVHKLRGWDRKALQEYKIIASMQSRHVIPPSQLGLSDALYSAQQKEDGKALLSKELQLHPHDLQAQRLAREFDVQEMRNLNIGFKYENSQDGAIDKTIFTKFTQPISLYTDLFFTEMVRRSKQNNLSASFDRFGIGVSHVFNRAWSMTEALSFDHGTGSDFSSLTSLDWTPDDYWSLNLNYTNYAVDMDVRSRVFGITSNKLGLAVNYRWSDWREAGLFASRSGFSDSNIRFEAGMYYGQNIFAKGDWRIHIRGDLYNATNTNLNALYFNPVRSNNMTATLMLEDNLWHRYDRMNQRYNRRFTHRLYLTSGVSWQRGFSRDLLLRFRYEQIMVFSDTHRFQWGINWGRRAFDGVQVGSYSIDGEYVWDF